MGVRNDEPRRLVRLQSAMSSGSEAVSHCPGLPAPHTSVVESQALPGDIQSHL